MPKKEIDYSKTVIYKIVCCDLNVTDNYVGSTTDFRKRKSHHKSVCNDPKSKDYNRKIYQTIRDNGGWDNWTMIEIEKYHCTDNNEAHTRERYWVEKLKSSLNIQVPARSKKEYREKNKEKIKEYRKINKDKINEKHKEYYEKNKEKIDSYNKEYMKQYRAENKEKLYLLKKEKHLCECGRYYTNNGKSAHMKTNKHREYLRMATLKQCLLDGLSYSETKEALDDM
jgi:hypothetical protein